MRNPDKIEAALEKCGVTPTPQKVEALHQKFLTAANAAVDDWVNANNIISGIEREKLYSHPGAGIVREATYLKCVSDMILKYGKQESNKT